MTVEERTRNIFTDEDVDEVGSLYIEKLQYRIAEALNDQIEDCAKLGDEQAAFHKSEAERLSRNEVAANCERTGEHASERIAARIRALAALAEEGKENGR